MEPASAQPLPGWRATWKPAHSLMSFSKVIEPAPFGSFMVSPGRRFSRSCAPLASLKPVRFFLFSWYTLCGRPEFTPSSPW